MSRLINRDILRAWGHEAKRNLSSSQAQLKLIITIKFCTTSMREREGLFAGATVDTFWGGKSKYEKSLGAITRTMYHHPRTPTKPSTNNRTDWSRNWSNFYYYCCFCHVLLLCVMLVTDTTTRIALRQLANDRKRKLVKVSQMTWSTRWLFVRSFNLLYDVVYVSFKLLCKHELLVSWFDTHRHKF